jgi:hypothetical protein
MWAAITFIVICATVVVCAPLAFIWMLNKLFKLGIAYDVLEWFASLMMLSMFAVAAL